MKNNSKAKRTIIKTGFELLKVHKAYSKAVIVRKMTALNFKVGQSSFCNIINDKRAGSNILDEVSRGIQKLILLELGYKFDVVADEYIAEITASSKLETIPEIKGLSASTTFATKVIIHEKGRLTTTQKVAFFENATEELIEVGVRLRSFTDYLTGQGEDTYKNPLTKLLARGVDISCFILDPTCQQARLYFEDRAIFDEKEKKSLIVINESIKSLVQLKKEFDKEHLEGQLKIFKYKHIPYCHFMIVDPKTEHAKMIYSPYLFGLKRGLSPVFQISKADNPHLFKKYWTSFQALISTAKSL
jgi:hypothetical protein